MRDYLVWLAKLVTVFVVIGVFFVVLLGSISAVVMTVADDVQIEPDGKHKVAVIELTGEIQDSKETLKQLYKQAGDKSINGIVLRVDSPGGVVGPSQEIYQAVKRIKSQKPIVASYGSVAASGGLYASIAATKIIAQPGTLTGSIGVLMQFPNFTEVASKVGATMITIKSGKLKDAGNPFRQMSIDDQEYLQSVVLNVYEDFIKAISESRNLDLEKVKQFGDGRIITGSQAKELGLVDDFGDVYTAAEEIFKIKGIKLEEGEQPTLVYPKEKFKEFRELMHWANEWKGRLSPGVQLKAL